MEVVHARCAGLDVHKQTVVACVRVATAGRARHEVRTFATTAVDLRALQEWLVAAGCTHAVLESTGVYWKPVWHRLEEHLTLVLANATTVRNLPGRKSDVSDAQWLADLLAHGLVRGSFVPPAPIQALRELTRTRKQLGRDVTAHSQRIEKVLESADVKLAAVLRPLLGVSGRAILAALAAGETDPDAWWRWPTRDCARSGRRCGRRCWGMSGPIIASCCSSTCGWWRRCRRPSRSWTRRSRPRWPRIAPRWPTS
jgi:transposase